MLHARTSITSRFITALVLLSVISLVLTAPVLNKNSANGSEQHTNPELPDTDARICPSDTWECILPTEEEFTRHYTDASVASYPGVSPHTQSCSLVPDSALDRDTLLMDCLLHLICFRFSRTVLPLVAGEQTEKKGTGFFMPQLARDEARARRNANDETSVSLEQRLGSVKPHSSTTHVGSQLKSLRQPSSLISGSQSGGFEYPANNRAPSTHP
ncbi:hypothetical protein SeLEV6574_g08315 [Synchytrium endobioticum]|uniref:Transmembrane protein n=1 Tax=Synchytrium endobioticum TaxID=286115 RepID=A0A507C7Z3_9FUNG|nr:hypothetical protein SeLEV6574_g08315 [Synchytrium endobioticum]